MKRSESNWIMANVTPASRESAAKCNGKGLNTEAGEISRAGGKGGAEKLDKW